MKRRAEWTAFVAHILVLSVDQTTQLSWAGVLSNFHNFKSELRKLIESQFLITKLK
jgi:hypothetical protein